MSAHVTILRPTRGQATDGINLFDGHVKTTVSHVTACAKTTTDMAAHFVKFVHAYIMITTTLIALCAHKI
jgi:nucleoside-diphosphate-sugar epimerase